MTPKMEILPEKKVIGKRVTMTFTDNKTVELWRSFMPRRQEITNNLTTDLLCMQIYDLSLDSEKFNPNTVFDKWAVVEVSDFENVPQNMEMFTLPTGLYAVFLYRGDARNFSGTFQYIFETWLPNSEYTLDNRPHFEILGEKYKNNSPDSEEEIWVPVKRKK
jgi:AraC family transcriptional regulator